MSTSADINIRPLAIGGIKTLQVLLNGMPCHLQQHRQPCPFIDCSSRRHPPRRRFTYRLGIINGREML
jgi:hypothetical protein